jgi:hypothetical protein
MKKYWDSLRPLEKRLFVGIAAVFFIVLNFWFVFPHFSDWSNVQKRMADARAKLVKFETEIAKKPTYMKMIKDLAGEGMDVPADDQANQFQRTFQIQAGQSGVNITTTGKQTSKTNQFFLELTENVGVQSGEKQLVDFLYSLGSGTSQIRVRDMSLHPDPARQQLVANLKLVASYQKATGKPGSPSVKLAANSPNPPR